MIACGSAAALAGVRQAALVLRPRGLAGGQHRVGRGHDGQPGKAVGTCEKCGTAFSFYPVIKPGELIAQQYEVAGAIAYGGMGWIYLARDRNVSDRWVVLKGLLNASDDDASAAAKSVRL